MCQNDKFYFVNKDHVPTVNDQANFTKLYDQYLERFGLEEEMIKLLECKEHLTALRLEFVKTGEKMLLNYIAIEEQNLKNLDPKGTQGMSISECIVQLSKHQGFWINKKEITIVDFKNLMKNYGRSSK